MDLMNSYQTYRKFTYNFQENMCVLWIYICNGFLGITIFYYINRKFKLNILFKNIRGSGFQNEMSRLKIVCHSIPLEVENDPFFSNFSPL